MSSKKSVEDKVRCPKCHKYEHVGYLGGSSLKKYFCSNPECCIEFTVKGKCVEMFEITSGGTTVQK